MPPDDWHIKLPKPWADPTDSVLSLYLEGLLVAPDENRTERMREAHTYVAALGSARSFLPLRHMAVKVVTTRLKNRKERTYAVLRELEGLGVVEHTTRRSTVTTRHRNRPTAFYRLTPLMQTIYQDALSGYWMLRSAQVEALHRPSALALWAQAIVSADPHKGATDIATILNANRKTIQKQIERLRLVRPGDTHESLMPSGFSVVGVHSSGAASMIRDIFNDHAASYGTPVFLMGERLGFVDSPRSFKNEVQHEIGAGMDARIVAAGPNGEALAA